MCSYSGCGLGRECVYDNSWICTPDKPDIPCQCQQGKCVCFTHLLGHYSLCWLSCLGPLLLLLKKIFILFGFSCFLTLNDLIDIIPETRCAHLSPFFFVVVVNYYICRYIWYCIASIYDVLVLIFVNFGFRLCWFHKLEDFDFSWLSL